MLYKSLVNQAVSYIKLTFDLFIQKKHGLLQNFMVIELDDGFYAGYYNLWWCRWNKPLSDIQLMEMYSRQFQLGQASAEGNFWGKKIKQLLISEYLLLMHLIILIMHMVLNGSGRFYFTDIMFKEETA